VLSVLGAVTILAGMRVLESHLHAGNGEDPSGLSSSSPESRD
jgi:hypothetical protein